VFEPLDFLTAARGGIPFAKTRTASSRSASRTGAYLPRPRAHLLTYHGVLAPAAKWRELSVPRPPRSAGCTQLGSHGEQPPQQSPESPPTANARQPKQPTRSTWPELMLRAFSIDVLTCPHCGGLRELIAFITEGLVVLPRSSNTSGSRPNRRGWRPLEGRLSSSSRSRGPDPRSCFLRRLEPADLCGHLREPTVNRPAEAPT